MSENYDEAPCLACNRPASDPVHQWDADAELSNLTTEVTPMSGKITTEDVRLAFVSFWTEGDEQVAGLSEPEATRQFDTWLAAHDRQGVGIYVLDGGEWVKADPYDETPLPDGTLALVSGNTSATDEQWLDLRESISEEIALGGDASTIVITVREWIDALASEVTR